MSYTPDELDTCLRVLQDISEDPTVMDEHKRFKSLITKIHREAKKIHARTSRTEAAAQDRQEKQKTQRVKAELNAIGMTAIPADSHTQPTFLLRPKRCYICKQLFTELHFFYHLMCPACADNSYQKRNQRVDLKGRTALITGGRIKIGYQIALRMLRDGARVILTTRFPQNAASRFETESDYTDWQHRLEIHGLDLRFVPAVEEFARWLVDNNDSLDILINNAAQTIKRPAAFYAHLLEGERLPTAITGRSITSDLQASNVLDADHGRAGELVHFFPPGWLDSDGQQVDLRPMNSWQQRLGDVSAVDMLEAQLINAVAPFVLASELKPLMTRSSFPRRFIINVSAMEGQFNRERKTVYHPHTNMAKAALNMLTRTAAADYARDGIFMNSVDTGWITDENAHPKRTWMREEAGFYTPLDAIDGMARVYHPIVEGLDESREPIFGCFLKDYAPYPW